MIFKITLFFIIINTVLFSCTSPMKKKEIKQIEYSCSSIDRKIMKLDNEKNDNNKRVISGARSIIPIGIVVGAVQRNYFDHLSVATGSWGKAIDEKLLEMTEFKKECSG